MKTLAKLGKFTVYLTICMHKKFKNTCVTSDEQA